MALFQKWNYEQLPTGSTKQEYINRVRQLSNVANKRAKTLVKAANKGKINLRYTGYRRYEKALKYINEVTERNYKYATTGKTLYTKLTLAQLRAIESKLLRYLASDTSTGREAIEAESKVQTKFKSHYGVSVQEMEPEIREQFIYLMEMMKQEFKEEQYSSDRVVKQLLEFANTDKTENMMRFFDKVDRNFKDPEFGRKFKLAVLKTGDFSDGERAKLKRRIAAEYMTKKGAEI